MNYPFPDYPRDKDHDIHDSLCHDCLRVWAEFGSSYLWDMNGVSIYLSTVTGKEPEPLDDEWLKWVSWYEDKPVTEDVDVIWDSPGELHRFNEQGSELARRTFDYLGGRHTVVYFPIDAPAQRWDAQGKPPIRIEP